MRAATPNQNAEARVAFVATAIAFTVWGGLYTLAGNLFARARKQYRMYTLPASIGAIPLLIAGSLIGRTQDIWLCFGLSLVCLLLSAGGFAGAAQQYQHEHNDRTAIIFSQSVSIKSSPDAQSTDLFVLHEGVKVDLLDAVGEWRKIRLADGKIGWLAAADLQVI